MSKREMLINYAPGEECRIAIIEDGRLEELYQERASAESHVGNIYKGRVAHIERSIQAAFIDFGLDRHGFLHLSDLHPMYFAGSAKEESERVGKKTPHHERPPIQRCLKRGQEINVQVLKEGIGTKGPTVTSYLSIPGRFLVLMPFMERLGVSRKVEDDDARREIRKALDEMNPPKEFGFIIRTAGIGRTKADLKRDLAYLQRQWKAIEQRRKTTTGVGELYAESDLIIRTLRDVFSSDIERVVIDHESAARRAQNFLAIANPRAGSSVVYYDDPLPLFHRFDIERQIENVHSREVDLPTGGSLVIDSTEALVAIDVNSGKSRESRDAETNAYKVNLEAADEVCRQLRLRDLGGVVVIDLIDMRALNHRRDIEQRFKTLLKNDRARTQVSSISQFGILEMTRQRMRPSLKTSVYMSCPSCHGAGQTKSPESVVLDAMRRLALVMQHPDVIRVELIVSPDVAFHLLNVKRAQLVALEQKEHKPVTVRVGGGSVDHIEIKSLDAQDGMVDAENIEALKKRTPKATAPSPVTRAPEPALDVDEDEPSPPASEAEIEAETGDTKPRRRRRRRGGRGKGTAQANTDQPNTDQETATDESNPVAAPGPTQAKQDQPEQSEPPEEGSALSTEGAATNGRPRRRRRRGGRGKSATTTSTEKTADQDQPAGHDDTSNPTIAAEAQSSDPPKRTTRRRRRSRSKPKAGQDAAPADALPVVVESQGSEVQAS